MVEKLTSREKIRPDKRFVYYMLAAAGICVMPLTSFSTDLQGFRFTLLEQDEDTFRQMIDKLAMSITNYLES